jgi:hypothetical protein
LNFAKFMTTRSWIRVVGVIAVTASSVVAAQAPGIYPNPITFGSVVAGSTSTQVASLINLGSNGVDVSNLSVGGAANGYTRAGGTCPTVFPFTVAAGAFCTVNVQLVASATPGSSSGSLEIVSSAGNSSTPIRATTVVPGMQPTPSVATLDFGLSPTAGFKTQSVTFTNVTGDRVDLLGLSGSPLPVAIQRSEINSLNSYNAFGSCARSTVTGLVSSLGSGESCTIEVSPFLSSAPGRYDTTMTLETSIGNAKVSLRSAVGTSIDALVVNPSLVDFGSPAAGSTTTNTVTFSAPASGATSLFALALRDGGDASFSRAGGTCPTTFPATIPAGTSCTVILQFVAPANPTYYYGWIEFVASTGNGLIPIRATPYALGTPPTPSVTTLDFGLSPGGSEYRAYARTVTFTNSTANTVDLLRLSGSPVPIDLVLRSSFGRLAYDAGGSCVRYEPPRAFPFGGGFYSLISSLAPGASCNLSVQMPFWNSLTAGSYDTTLSLVTSAGNSVVNLRAAVGPVTNPIVVTPSTLSLTRASGNLATETGSITLSNPAPVAATIVGIDVPAPFQRNGGTCPSTFPAPLAGGASCTVTILVPAGPTLAPLGDFAIFADTGNQSVTLKLETALGNGDTDNDGIPDAVEIAEDRNLIMKDNQIFAGQHSNANRWFAMQQYRDFLSREAEATGLTDWTSRLNSNSMSREAVIQGFFGSPEFQAGVPSIVRLYLGFFNRIPDSAGLKGWVEAVRAGTSVATVASSFARSQEFSLTYGALTDAQFVTLVYRNVLGRAPDTAGFNGWIARLNSGASRGDVMVGFTESVEFQLQTAPNVFVIMMYEGMLRRAAEPAGYQYWVDYINSGQDALEITRGFLYSQEYRSRFLP